MGNKHSLYNDENLHYEPNMAVVMYISSEEDIEGADTIKKVTVTDNKSIFSGVVKKDELSVGDKCIVFMQDSILPESEIFRFMEKRKYKVTQCRFLNSPSEVLIIPLNSFSDTTDIENIGADFTNCIGVWKYEKTIPAELSGTVKGNFPSVLFPKTDEILFQKAENFIHSLIGKPYYITEKIDGTSQSVYIYNGKIGACSRNLEIKLDDSNGTCAVKMLIDKYNIEHVLSSGIGNIALQWECYGQGINKNPLGINGIEMAVFNMYDIDNKCYFSFDSLREFCQLHNLPMVKIIEEGDCFQYSDHEQLLILAEGKYPNGHEREGIVIRPKSEMVINGQRLSFKVINLKYKEK